MQEFMLPMDFMDNYILKAKPEYAMVYLYAHRHREGNRSFESSEIAEALGIEQSLADEAVSYWIGLGFDIFRPKAEKTPVKPSYSVKELNEMSKNDTDFKFICTTVETITGKVLTLGNYSTLAYIYKEIGLSSSTIILITNYAKKVENPTIRYIEKIAHNLEENQATTYEEAEKFISEMDRSYAYQNKIKKMYGIDRNLTQKEKDTFNTWLNQIKPKDEELMRAFDECIERTGKFTARYINAILVNWKNEKSKPKKTNTIPTPKATKFNNFESSGNIDYKKLEMEAIKKRIARLKEGANNG